MRVGAALSAALAFLSCNPIEEPSVPGDGYSYVLELGASSVEFTAHGGSFTLNPQGITFYDGQIQSVLELTPQDLEISFVYGNDFVTLDGLTFTAGQTSAKRTSYWRVTWRERGISKEICLTQRKP